LKKTRRGAAVRNACNACMCAAGRDKDFQEHL
jgi:hypothetical protein